MKKFMFLSKVSRYIFKSKTNNRLHDQKAWYAVSIRKGREKRIIRSLTRKKLETYWPVYPERGNTSLEKSLFIDRPMHSSLLFVYISAQEMEIVSATRGIFNFLYWLDKPAVISPDDIAILGKTLKLFGEVWLEKSKVIFTGEKEFIFPEVPDEDDNLQKVLLPTMGYILVAAEPNYTVRRLSVSQQKKNQVSSPE